MIDRWSDRLARVDRAVDRVMSETVRFVPMVSGDYAEGVEDPARAAFELDAVLVLDRGETDLGGNSRQVRNARVVTAPAELHVQRTLLTGKPDLRKNDRVIALATGDTYTIAHFDRSHRGRLVMHLSIAAEFAS